MTSGDRWGRTFVSALRDAGVEEAEARELADDAIAEAGAAGGSPSALFGPAVAYAASVAQAIRVGTAPSPMPRAEPGRVMLRLTGVTKRYRRRTVLGPVSLELRAGQVAAVVGANGSGKSTLLKVCAGLVRASAGKVERVASIGYAPQHHGIASLLTPADHFRLFGAVRGMSARKAVVVGEQLAAQLGWRPQPDHIAGRLSGGTQQKLNVVLSRLHRPDLVLLDEPYQGFDQDSYLDFWDQVYRWRDDGTAVLVVTHLLHELDRVDHVVELHPRQDV